MKKIIAILAVALLGFTGTVTAQKYGHLNAQEVLTSVPGYEAASKEMERYRESQAAQLQDLQANMQKEYQKYITDKDKLSKSIQAEREAEIMELQQNAQNFEQSAQKKIEKKYTSLMNPLLKQINEAIKAVGKKNGFAYIFDISQGIVVYHDGGTDVTPLVVAELKKNKVTTAAE